MTKKKWGTNTKIPGLSFSWKRALGLTRARQQIAWKVGIPTTKTGMQRKLGGAIFKRAGCLLPVLLAVLAVALIVFL